MKSPFRWAGSKSRIAAILSKEIPRDFRYYIEPFAGSAALFFKLEPEKAILADLNAELINAYQVIRNRHKKLDTELSKLKNSSEEYYRLRRLDTDTLCNLQKAVRFIYLNRFCFNGLYRTNLNGDFNVPYGGSKSGKLPMGEVLNQTSLLLRRSILKNADFEKTLSLASSDDFVYLDPPFKTQNKRTFREYGPKTFQQSDVDRLKSSLETLTSYGISFMLSYADCEEGRRLSKGYNCQKIDVRRNIAGFHSNRKLTTELLIKNYD